jgi:hypothetical protein
MVCRASVSGLQREEAKQLRLILLALGFLPYLALAGYDGWLHEKARVVPRVEKWLHAGLFVALSVFIALVVRERTMAALAAFAAFVALLLIDELGYHADLARHERRIHWLADFALGAFVVYWLWFDGILG